MPPERNPSKEKPLSRRGDQQTRTALYRLAGVALTRIDGISAGAAEVILTEVGFDLSAIPTEEHFVSWWRLVPAPQSRATRRYGKRRPVVPEPPARRSPRTAYGSVEIYVRELHADVSWREIHDLLTLEGTQLRLARRYNVVPGQFVAIVRWDGAGRRFAMLRWGLVPGWAGDPAVGSRLINAWAETAASKPTFRGAYPSRRCLMPASGFYEGGAPAPSRSRTSSVAATVGCSHSPDSGSAGLCGDERN